MWTLRYQDSVNCPRSMVSERAHILTDYPMFPFCSPMAQRYLDSIKLLQGSNGSK